MEFKSDHAGDILDNLNRERTSSKDFCDFTIKAGNEKFAIHRCVVGSFSKFFKNLLTAEMKEKYSKEATVQFSPTVVELVINFIYTSCVKISMDSVYDVLEASEFLEIPYLKDYCEKVFKKHLTGGNCLKIRTYAKLYQMQEITQLAESCICDNLSSVLQSEEFCGLAVDDVGSLLDIDNEEPTIDECKYSSLIKWTKHDIDARSSKFSSLFTLIDVQWLSKKFINTVVLKECDKIYLALKLMNYYLKLVGDSFECMSRLVTALTDLVPEDLTKKTRKPVHKSAKDEAENVLLVGGHGCPQSVVKYNVKSKQFSNDMPNTSVSRVYASAVNCNGRIFLMGGYDGGTTFNSVEILNLNESTLKWEINQTSMIETRCWFASALLNDVIYCVGGIDDRNCQSLSSVEGYDVKVGKWFGKNKMNQVRSGHALVSTQGMLFAIGGFDGNRITNTAEMFDPNVGNWRNIPSMKTHRNRLCAVVLNQEIYAIGGYDGDLIGGRDEDGNHLSSVEKYNLASRRWSDVASMKEKRTGGSACVVNGRIYVFGGSPAKTVQSYDQEMNEWFIEAEMDKQRSYLSVVSI